MPRGIYPRESAGSRFWAKVEKTEDCWNWLGNMYSGGYGVFWNHGQVRAHRYAYELHRGPIPEGLQIDHLCRNRIYVNPDHMEAVTQKVNMMRGIGPAARHAAATHCPQGHPYDLFNTYITVEGWRKCRTCHRDWRNP
ncbi:hypothetical protein LCGC14_1116570 [marine sediment metagenome]|uniref:HNH nuclease domain-containing protein n=1 Tax=marine sediment metagenome TaxID=412755 RepID=A0A0F9QB03_9ZZZZ